MLQRLRTYYDIAVADLRYQGLQVLFWRTVVKLASPFVKLDLQILFEMDLREPLEPRPARVPCVIEPGTEADIEAILDGQMRLLSPVELEELSDEEELQYTHFVRARAKAQEGFRHAMRAGEVCFVARVEGQVAHSNWIRFHDCGPVDSRPVELAPGEVYTTDGFTDERWRGQRLHEAVNIHMLRYAQARGCHRAYTITDLTKAGSRRGVRRIGWKERGIILYATPRGLGRTWLFRLSGDLEPMFRYARETATGP